MLAASVNNRILFVLRDRWFLRKHTPFVFSANEKWMHDARAWV